MNWEIKACLTATSAYYHLYVVNEVASNETGTELKVGN